MHGSWRRLWRTLLVHQHDAPGLVFFSDKAHLALPNGCRQQHLDEFLLALECVTPSGRTHLKAGLTEAGAGPGRRGLAIVISDLLSLDGSIFDQLQLQGQELLVFHIVAPEEVDFNFHGDFEMEDAETGQKVIVHASAFRDEYLRRFQSFLGEAKRECEKLEADYYMLRTDQPLEEALGACLEARLERK